MHEKELADEDPKVIADLKKEIATLTQSLETERHSQLIDVQNRFRRCLEILQIHDVKGLQNFMKGADNGDDDHEEFIAMKFNMTKAESALLLKRVLCLTGAYSKQEMIERFI